MGSAKSGKTSGNQWSTGLNNAWNNAFNVSGGGSVSSGSSSQGVWSPQAQALQGIYGQAGQLASGQGAMAQQAQGVNNAARNAWQQSLQPGGNPYFSNNVQASIDQATNSFKRQVMPELTAGGVGAGAYGTQRDALARSDALGQFGQGISQMAGQMYSNQYATDQAMRQQSLAMAPQMQAMQTAPLTTASGIIGGPTVLGASEQQGESTQYGVGSSMGGSMGSVVSGGKSSGKDQGIGVGAK